ncbi:hypothetical protein EBZ80_09470 [bacterium]|nr:hypothetical protein [bacterium]
MTRARAVSSLKSLVIAGSILTAVSACSGRTPDGKPCRRNTLQFLPVLNSDMSQTCPQDPTYYKGAGKTAPGELSPEAPMPEQPAN